MTWTRPTRQDLIDRSIADLASRINGGDASLRRSNLNVLARVKAGGEDGLYGYLAYLADQLFPDTCDETVLARFGSLWGKPRIAATFATGSVQISGVAGTLIAAGTVLQRADGVTFQVDADVTVVGTTATATVTASSADAASNTTAGTALTFVSPIDGVTGNAAVAAAGLGGGADIETIDSWRARILARIQKPPQGGSLNDYIEWVQDVVGITRVWAYKGWLGAGTVGVFFTLDSTPSTPIPGVATIAAVQAHIDGLRPVTAAVTVLAPTADPVNYIIQLTPNSAAVQAAVQAALIDLHTREGASGGTLLLSHINEAISLATGETDHVLVSPVANIVTAQGHLPTVGTFTWQ